MKNQHLLSILLMVITSSAMAQYQVKGQLLDQQDNGIFFGTVALYSLPDSLYLTAESSDEDGQFVFDGVAAGDYYVFGNMLGFADYRSEPFIVSNSNIDLGAISMLTDAALLETVEIKEKAPLMEQKADRLIVNVENNMTNTNGSLLDVMKKVPGILVINDRMTMVGSGSPTILINGKSTQYMDVQSLLRDMPGDNIKKVEVIHQPGAEFEAQGSGPIINIIFKKNVLFGTNGSVNIGVGKGELWDYTTGLNLSHYAGRLNIIGGLGYAKNAWIEELSLTRRLSNISEDIDGVYDQLNRDAATPNTVRGNVRIDWDVTDKHRFGFETKYYNNDNERIANNVTDVLLTSDNFTDYQLNTSNDIDRAWTYNSLNPYYIFEIDTSGQKLELDFSWARYKVDGVNTLTTSSTLNNDLELQRYTQPGETKIIATTLDYTKPLGEIFELKLGTKYSSADLDNNLLSEFSNGNGNWMNNVNQSNHYLFDEDILGIYTKLNWAKGDWSGTVGLRYENSESVGYSITLDSTLTRDISKLFPSFSISKKLTQQISTSLAYSYRIDRPRYSTLNPFVYYIDPFTFEAGNPNIRPELTHSARFNVAYEGQPFFNVEYKQSSNAIVEVTQQDPDSQEASKTDVNFDTQKQFSVMLILPLEFIPGISGYVGGILARNAYESQYIDALFERSRWTTTAFAQIEFKLPFDINAEIGGWYNSGEQEGIFNSEYLYGTSFGMSKKFLNDKAKISLGVEDFFNRFWYANVDYQQDMDLRVTWQAPVVNMRFSYKFGNQHLKSKSKTKSSASEELRRASQG